MAGIYKREVPVPSKHKGVRMIYKKSLGDFVSSNHGEVVKVVSSICHNFNHAITSEDIVQDLYLKMHRKKLLGKYDPEISKISTYLFPIAQNIAKAEKKKGSTMIEDHRVSMEYFDYISEDDSYSTDSDMLDVNFEGMVSRNGISDAIDGVNLDFDLFERHLEQHNKHYKLKRRKNKAIKTGGMYILDVFRLLRVGYSNRDIAKEYGVSDMFITMVKDEVSAMMKDFGIVWNYRQERRRKKLL